VQICILERKAGGEEDYSLQKAARSKDVKTNRDLARSGMMGQSPD
jgi:hypothetical protein